MKKCIGRAFLAGVTACVVLASPLGAKQSLEDAARSLNISLPEGYIQDKDLPDSNIYIPSAPAAGGAVLQLDEAAAASALALSATPRFEQATRDARIASPTVTNLFSCAAGVALGATTTPLTDRLMRKTMTDFALGGYQTKEKYQRARPFMVNNRPICTPEIEKALRQDGSYPSGHSTIGFGWGLLLAELLPARAAQLVERGRAFGDSRMVCNVHWLSDVEEGRMVAAAIVARLHAAPAFRSDMDAARKELAEATARPAVADCTREDAALATPWKGNR